MRILLTGGGTGGHTIPIVAVVRELVRQRKDLKLFWLGDDHPEERAARENHIPFQKIACGKFRRYFSFWNLIDFFKIPAGIFQSFFLILGFKPNVIFSKGGYVSLPVVIAAWILHKKIIVHESDAVPGLANRIAAHLASKVLLGFNAHSAEKLSAKSLQGKYIFTGNPVRQEILKGDPVKARDFFHLSKDKPTILAMGGSQGARFINDLIRKLLGKLKGYQIVHLTGVQSGSSQRLEPAKGKMRDYRSYSYLDGEKIALAYSIADLIISRAGANSLAEIAACAKPSILIPLPSAASDHQLANAKIFEKRGASIILEQKDLTSRKLISLITSLFKNPNQLETMRKKAKGLAKFDAARKIASEILEK
ncbi:MAG: undecaprenyldiphospho-muramoylpentapeptide beta-N-acetylglucosaminyltransferase [Patescibacteria group bacterium]|nr:undecaprenyldiphospho-muramoylpentapeptide beta-N-acetylglucosaminyltransferase [Patescibacteria group bacterium]